MRPAPLDTAALVQLAEILGRDGAREVVQALRDEAGGIAQACEAALQAEDRVALARQAHTLKANCALVGAQALSIRCAALEHAARRDDPGSLRSQLAALDADLRGLVRALDTWLAQP